MSVFAAEPRRLAAREDGEEGARLSYLDFLDQLLQAEQPARFERTVEVRTRLARLPYHKTMANLGYGSQPSVDKKQIAELLTLRFVEQRENVLLNSESQPPLLPCIRA